jgi:hypothetical protein
MKGETARHQINQKKKKNWKKFHTQKKSASKKFRNRGIKIKSTGLFKSSAVSIDASGDGRGRLGELELDDCIGNFIFTTQT